MTNTLNRKGKFVNCESMEFDIHVNNKGHFHFKTKTIRLWGKTKVKCKRIYIRYPPTSHA